MDEHMKGVEIVALQIDNIPDKQEEVVVGKYGVTRIEAFTKSGMHSNIPYFRVWKDDVPTAEFCQHNIVGVYFKQDPAP